MTALTLLGCPLSPFRVMLPIKAQKVFSATAHGCFQRLSQSPHSVPFSLADPDYGSLPNLGTNLSTPTPTTTAPHIPPRNAESDLQCLFPLQAPQSVDRPQDLFQSRVGRQRGTDRR